MHLLFRNHLENALGGRIEKVSRVSGGDISEAHRLETGSGSFFVKSTSGPNALTMYEAEARGLQQLAATKAIGVPEVILVGCFEEACYLILTFVETKRPAPTDFEKLGHHLSKLHLSTNKNRFGNDHDNFIGSLPQSNAQNDDWSTFYVTQRLIPQFKLAIEKGLLSANLVPDEEKMVTFCKTLIGDVAPSLLHGDLWGGNYLISEKGKPYLIDPAAYWGHSEIDLAMSKLFGGFGSSFYEAYHENIPPHENQVELTQIYQLYYLLVHLNLFGTSYLNVVVKITQKYFN